MHIKKLILKEIKHLIKSYRLLIIIILPLFLGLSTPPLVKLMPTLLQESLAGQNIRINITGEHFWTGVLATYSKNIVQFWLFIQILVTMGLIADERKEGKLLLLFSKPVSKFEYLFSKFFVFSLSLMLSLSLSTVCCCYYTNILFEGLEASLVIGQYFSHLAILIFFLSVTLLFSTIFKKSFLAGIFSFCVYFLLLITCNLYPITYLPLGIMSMTQKVSPQLAFSTDLCYAIGATFICTIIIFLLSYIFLLKADVRP